jgi:HIRAN domain
MSITFELRGAKFRPEEVKAKILALTSGDQIFFELEPTNKYDPNAIKVIGADSTFLGYVSKEHAEDVGKWLLENNKEEGVGVVVGFVGPYAPLIETHILPF